VVYSGSDVHPDLESRHAVIHGRDTGRSRLVIVNVQPTDAGSYSCKPLTRAAKISTTELTVVGGHPSRSNNIDVCHFLLRPTFSLDVCNNSVAVKRDLFSCLY